ncbi:MAG TPA: hypothetical protein VNX25_09305 [Verrucomicrobiae bacterium]|nr:hypothetical protein [Verrucomicrobiae bacterium]
MTWVIQMRLRRWHVLPVSGNGKGGAMTDGSLSASEIVVLATIWGMTLAGGFFLLRRMLRRRRRRRGGNS